MESHGGLSPGVRSNAGRRRLIDRHEVRARRAGEALSSSSARSFLEFEVVLIPEFAMNKRANSPIYGIKYGFYLLISRIHPCLNKK
jgi:hypothetical protein